jgi:hypothetical protein
MKFQVVAAEPVIIGGSRNLRREADLFASVWEPTDETAWQVYSFPPCPVRFPPL